MIEYVILLGIINGIFTYIFIENEYEYLDNEFCMKAGIFTSILTIIIQLISPLIRDLISLTFNSIMACILSILMIEDELKCEMSLYLLIILGLFKIFFLIYSGFDLSYMTILFGNLLFLSIYFLSKKMMGIGDILLNGILSLSFDSMLNYFNFFTITFLLGSLFVIIGLLTKKLRKNDSIPFVKFMVISYIFYI